MARVFARLFVTTPSSPAVLSAKQYHTTALLNAQARILSAGLISGRLRSSKKRLRLTWSDGSEDVYPLAWLRDMCRCEKCHHKSAASRLLPFRSLMRDEAIALRDVSRNLDGSSVACHWLDGHTSAYDARWLQGAGSLRLESRRRRHDDIYLSGRHASPWPDVSNGSFHLPSGSYDKIVNDDREWVDFIQQLRRTGAFLIQASPNQDLCKELVAKRGLLVRGTNYGQFWTVDVRLRPHDLAFTDTPLELHSDLLFYSRPPQVVWFHCIKQADIGGETVLCDGLSAAIRLRESMPKAFDALTRIPVDHWATGSDSKGYGSYQLAHRKPMLGLDEYGDVHEIGWNSSHRAYHSCSSADDLEEWYEAGAEFFRILDSAACKISHRLEPGDLLVFDNLRVLHGRESFSTARTQTVLKEDSGRLLEGFYNDWDDMLSTYRVVEQRLKGSKSE